MEYLNNYRYQKADYRIEREPIPWVPSQSTPTINSVKQTDEVNREKNKPDRQETLVNVYMLQAPDLFFPRSILPPYSPAFLLQEGNDLNTIHAQYSEFDMSCDFNKRNKVRYTIH